MPLGLKDIRAVLEAAEAKNVPMPVASLLRDHFITGIARGEADLDWSALARLTAQDADCKKIDRELTPINGALLAPIFKCEIEPSGGKTVSGGRHGALRRRHRHSAAD